MSEVKPGYYRRTDTGTVIRVVRTETGGVLRVVQVNAYGIPRSKKMTRKVFDRWYEVADDVRA